ncbi:MAG: SPFH domain-containing protein [Synechococcaceae cyanobacterium]|nr:SPFH domain-containing protein [Synechococcaceae cyanobacterium]
MDIIEWSEAVPGAPPPGGNTLAWRFDRAGSGAGSRALSNGSQLIVREGQWALFLDEGRIADAFGPGRHTLSTANLPILTSLLCLPSGFESPFKAEVVFVATRLFSDLRWGTRHPLLLRDPELGPVRLRGFGTYSLRVSDPAWLVREVSGAGGRLELDGLSDPLRNLIVSRLADVLGRCGCPVFDLSSHYESLGRELRLALSEEVQQYGLEIPLLLIEALTLPPEVEAALDRRSSRLVEGAGGASLPFGAPPPPPPPPPPPSPPPAPLPLPGEADL